MGLIKLLLIETHLLFLNRLYNAILENYLYYLFHYL